MRKAEGPSAVRKVKWTCVALLVFLSSCLLPLTEQEYFIRKATSVISGFRWEEPVLTDLDGNFYFRSSGDVYRWRPDTTPEQLVDLEGSVLDIEIDTATGVLILAVGTGIWEYQLAGGELTQVFTDPESLSVNEIWNLGTHLIADCGTRPKNRRIRRSDYSVLSTIEWGDEYGSAVFVPSLNRRFILWNDVGYSPAIHSIGYEDIDLGTETFGAFVECYDMPDTVYGPLYVFPDETAVVTGDGAIYQTDDFMTEAGNLDTGFSSLAFWGDYIAIISSTWDWFVDEVLILSADTYETQGDPIPIPNVRNSELLVFDGDLYLFVEDSGGTTVFIFETGSLPR